MSNECLSTHVFRYFIISNYIAQPFWGDIFNPGQGPLIAAPWFIFNTLRPHVSAAIWSHARNELFSSCIRLRSMHIVCFFSTDSFATVIGVFKEYIRICLGSHNSIEIRFIHLVWLHLKEMEAWRLLNTRRWELCFQSKVRYFSEYCLLPFRKVSYYIFLLDRLFRVVFHCYLRIMTCNVCPGERK